MLGTKFWVDEKCWLVMDKKDTDPEEDPKKKVHFMVGELMW